MKILPSLAKIFWKIEIELLPSWKNFYRYFTWKIEFLSNILWMIVGQFGAWKIDAIFLFSKKSDPFQREFLSEVYICKCPFYYFWMLLLIFGLSPKSVLVGVLL